MTHCLDKSFLPGQRLCMSIGFDPCLIALIVDSTAACTCPGESHPGPVRSDGSYVGRSAPEIDVFEALVDPDGGKVCPFFHDSGINVETILQVSLSAQWAPYDVCPFLTYEFVRGAGMYVLFLGCVHVAEHQQQYDHIQHYKHCAELVYGRCV